MSRCHANAGLKTLLKEWSGRAGERLIMLDLASKCKASRRSLHLYTTGRRHTPLLEAKIAAVFEISVPELRRRLGLEEPQPKRRKLS